MLILHNKLVPENNLEQLFLREYIKAKAGTSLIQVPIENNPKMIGRILLENLYFDKYGIAEATIDIEAHNVNYYARNSLHYPIKFWNQYVDNTCRKKILVYWQAETSEISMQKLQVNSLPRLPSLIIQS